MDDNILNQPVEQTGIDAAAVSTPEAETDVVSMFLSAAGYKTDESLFVPITIKRAGKQVLPTFRVRPISEDEAFQAHKSATTYMANPANPRLPKIEKSTDGSLEDSYIIYTATVTEDRTKTWDNPQVIRALQAKYPAIAMGVQVIDAVLTIGEKEAVVQQIQGLSYPDDTNKVTSEEYAKN
jgi:hypothetical protein